MARTLFSVVIFQLIFSFSGFCQNNEQVGVAKKSVKKAKQRIALLIGNGNYPRGVLRNPVNDVDKMGASFRNNRQRRWQN